MSSGLVKIVVIGDSVPSIFQSLSGDTFYCSIPAASYQWYLNGTAISGANLNYIIPSDSGNYQIEISHTSGCSTRSSGLPFIHTGIISFNQLVALQISPNPFHHSVHVFAISKKPALINIVLRDIVGKIISSWQYNSLTTTFDEEYNLSDLSAGIYLMQYKTGDAQKTFKLVKYD